MSGTKLAACGPTCLLAHHFVNKLSVIIGQCELLDDHVIEPECAERLRVIRQTAHAMAAEINHHRSQVPALLNGHAMSLWPDS